MPLPVTPLPTSTVSMSGTDVEIRSLSRAQSLRMRAIREEGGDAEAYVLARSTGVSDTEAAEWLDAVTNDVALGVIRAIFELSGLVDKPADPKAKAPKSGA